MGGFIDTSDHRKHKLYILGRTSTLGLKLGYKYILILIPCDKVIPYLKQADLQLGLVLFVGSDTIAPSDYYSLPPGGTIVAIQCYTNNSINNFLLIAYFPQ